MSARRRSHHLLVGIGSTLALVALIVGIPVALWLLARSPLPEHLPSPRETGDTLTSGDLSDQTLIKIIALVGWIAWLQLILAIVVELVAWTRGRSAPHIPIAGMFQPTVRSLLAAAALLLSSPSTRPVMALPLQQASRPVTIEQATPVGPFSALPAAQHPAGPIATALTHTVVPGDTLWDIAERNLGDPFRWHDIYELSRGVIQPDGRHLDDPNLIIPGWVLRLPADSSVRDATTAAPPPPTSPPATNGSTQATPPIAPNPPPTTTPTPLAPSKTSTPGSPTSVPAEPPADSHDKPKDLPAPLLIGAGGLLAASLVTLLNRLRRVQQRRRQPGHRRRAPRPDLQQLEHRLRRAADLDAAEFLDLALRAFASGASSRTTPLPDVLACRAGADHIELLLAASPSRPPKGFDPTSDARGWITRPDLTANDLRALAAGAPAPLPSLVSLGTLEGEELLIDIGSAGVLTVDGDPEDVAALIRALTTQLATGTWIDHVDVLVAGSAGMLDVAGAARVRHVPDLAEALDELTTTSSSFAEALQVAECAGTLPARFSEEHDDGWIPTILICNDELDRVTVEHLINITGGGGKGVGVIARSSYHATWHAEVSSTELLLAPLGYGIRPNLIATETAQALDELLTEAAIGEAEDVAEPTRLLHVATTSSAHFADQPFDIEVRILGPIEIVGVPQPLTRPKHIELTAYLALHPNGVSDERLKTALWPDGKPTHSTFNTMVSTIRVALGSSPDGLQHLPHYQTSGQIYRLSRLVTTDLARFEARVAYARHHEPPEAIAALRAALELVRGQPFESTRGFEWAFSEGLVANAEAVVADAAHMLAQHYLEANSSIDANWAATQGLKGAPGDETLYRDRMLAYDLAGNPVGVERVMDELCEVVEALEPYDALHPETIALYERISHRKRSRAPANGRTR